MPLRLGKLRLALVDGGIASDEAEPPPPRVQPVPAQHPPDPVRRDPESAPLLAGEFGRDPLRAEARMSKREGDDPLLEMRPQLVRHPRPTPLPDLECFQPPAV